MDTNLNYHIIKITPQDKLKTILKTESACPICRSDNSEYRKEWIKGNIFHNHYRCQECGTEWYGNAFNEAYDYI